MRTTLLAVCLFLTAHAQAQDYPIAILGGNVTLEVETNIDPYKSTMHVAGPLDGVFETSHREYLRSEPGYAQSGASLNFIAGPFPHIHDGYGALSLELTAILDDTTFPDGERLFGTLARASGYYDIELGEPSIVSFGDILVAQDPVTNITLGGREIEFYYPPRSLQYQYRDMLLPAGTHRLAFDTAGATTVGGAQIIFNPVPEPGSVALLAIVAAGFITVRRWH